MSGQHRETDCSAAANGKLAMTDQVDSLKNQLAEAKRSLAEAEVRHRSTELQLREERRRFEDLYENAPDLYVSVCPKTRTVTRCNQTLLDRLGYCRDEVIGRDLMRLYHPTCHNGVIVAFKTFVKHGEVRETELVLRRKDGTALDVSLKVTAVRNEQGEILYSRSAWRDISNQKRMERQLRQREQALNHYGRISTLGEIVGQLAHELNQPLGAVANYLSGCRASIGEGAKGLETFEAVIVKAEDQARRASAIVKRLRRMAENKPINKTRVKIHDTVHEAFALMGPSLAEMQVEISLDLCPKQLTVAADRIQLEQVWVNLLANAIQALRQNTKSRIIQVSTRQVDSIVKITFGDNGCGFSADPSKLFEPFETDSPTGLGLGLSICRSIMRSLDGTIRAEPNQPEGALFTIELPEFK